VGRNFLPWDCKVTPADCVCQEGNTIGCIGSNDGRDAGLGLGLVCVFHIGGFRGVTEAKGEFGGEERGRQSGIRTVPVDWL